ncbi:hypothetical protein [Candidatus Sulfurimonas baltica]|uniref:Uncharacterized protein n=1 Tax=Candidatus Sulfurimonas baltica TaxID=2740404 RepID=A0A7S7LX47_9BACT|nr:hypothetical protein [Candidatus Sulfurimonas baltica]QOY53000.1 hypothetical protein HUE88_04770 [Candidatus Sulfurimonas baltica]
MKTKDINSVFGVAPATLFDWNKPEHKKHQLAKLLKSLELEEVLSILEKSNPKPKPMMLLSTVNCSIGDKSKHYTLTSLKKLFYKKEELNIYDKYALKTIKNEAMETEIEDFIHYYKIPIDRVQKLLSA